MSTQDIASKLWNLCNVLRDDGVTYHQYLNELTFILFLKLAPKKEGLEDGIPEEYRWKTLMSIKDNAELFQKYRDLLANLSTKSTNPAITQIYADARTMLRKPVNLRTLITSIDELDWYEGKNRDALGDIYEDLLERNAGEKKSGAGQYFTPRPLINVMVDLLAPQLGERWNDPACGTFGFMIVIDQYLESKYGYNYSLNDARRKFQKEEALSGVELVPDAHRLALMNAKLHGLDSNIILDDTLTGMGEGLKGYDGVLANPPFGTKRGGEKPTRTDFSIETSNKQLNFLMHIYRGLRHGGRAGVVLPDNVLFEDGDGQAVRRDLMDKCDLHTILRLPTGIFYAAGVKTNVLFFTKGKKETGNTKRVWFYDMRTDMPNFGKRTPFEESAFENFVIAYTGSKATLDNVEAEYDGVIDDVARTQVQGKDKRWKMISREQILKKDDSLDLGLMADPNQRSSEELGEPEDIAKAALAEIKVIETELLAILKELG
jgi:type I restriction enzyme M protein